MGLLDGVLGGALDKVTGGESATPGSVGGGSGALAALLPIVLGMLTGQSSGGGGSLGAMMGGLTGGGATGGGLGNMLGGMLGGASSEGGAGGLGALLEKFQGAGLGEHVKSWVGTGANMPLEPEAVGKVFGGDTISQIAKQTGMSEEQASSGLSQLIPQVIDQLTPNGQMPDLSQLASGIAGLQQKFSA